jgi:hypothetical protein
MYFDRILSPDWLNGFSLVTFYTDGTCRNLYWLSMLHDGVNECALVSTVMQE